MAQVKTFTVDGFGFANNEISQIQDLRIAQFAGMIVSGGDGIPPIKQVDKIIVVGFGKGSNPEPHAMKRGGVVRERLIEHLEDFGIDEIDLGSFVILGEPIWEKASNSIVTGEDRKAEIRVLWTEPDNPSILPLSSKETNFFVWALIGKKPERVKPGKLFKEFVEFTEVHKLLSSDPFTAGAKLFFTTYAKLLRQTFPGNSMENPIAKWGYMVGCAYSLMDEATGLFKTRALEKGNTAETIFAKGFVLGYGDMRSHLARFGDDKVLRLLLQRLSLIEAPFKPRSPAIRRIYAALLEVTEKELSGSAAIMYFHARKRCLFDYPNIGFSIDL